MLCGREWRRWTYGVLLRVGGPHDLRGEPDGRAALAADVDQHELAGLQANTSREPDEHKLGI